VALTEQIYLTLAMQNRKIKASVLCPGYIRTNILDSERIRPAAFRNKGNGHELTPEVTAILEQIRDAIENGTPPEDLAKYVFDAIREERFYMLSHPEYDTIINKRCQDILNRQNPDVMATLAMLSSPVEEH
jgi:hypothetical protein